MSTPSYASIHMATGVGARFEITIDADPADVAQFEQVVRIAQKLFVAKAQHRVKVETGQAAPCRTCGGAKN